jgi:hypothetical protein
VPRSEELLGERTATPPATEQLLETARQVTDVRLRVAVRADPREERADATFGVVIGEQRAGLGRHRRIVRCGRSMDKGGWYNVKRPDPMQASSRARSAEDALVPSRDA